MRSGIKAFACSMSSRAFLRGLAHPTSDLVRSFFGISVLPHADDRPSQVFEGLIVFTVALSITRELRRPVRSIRSRLKAVLRTTVPETTVDEDRNLRSGERNVRPRR